MAKLYIESLKYYWKYRANQKQTADKTEQSDQSAKNSQSETTSAGNVEKDMGVDKVKQE